MIVRVPGDPQSLTVSRAESVQRREESFTTPEIEQKGIEEDSDEDGLLFLDWFC